MVWGVRFGVFVLDGLEVHAHGFLDAVLNQFGDSGPHSAPSGFGIDIFHTLLVTHRGNGESEVVGRGAGQH